MTSEDGSPDAGDDRPDAGDGSPDTGDRRPNADDGSPDADDASPDADDGSPDTGDGIFEGEESGGVGRRTEGPFRVLPGRDGDEWLLLDVESADPTYVDREALPDVVPGNRLDVDLSWDGDDPVVEAASVETGTVFRFVRTSEPVFEAAETTFEAARAEGAAMNSRVTYGTDGDANGVLYTFADQAGSRDVFGEFRDGGKPLDPLVARAAQAEGVVPPFSVWVLDPDEPFVLVYIVLDPDGLLEETMQDTYA